MFGNCFIIDHSDFPSGKGFMSVLSFSTIINAHTNSATYVMASFFT